MEVNVGMDDPEIAAALCEVPNCPGPYGPMLARLEFIPERVLGLSP